jgi:hypothetical protein
MYYTVNDIKSRTSNFILPDSIISIFDLISKSITIPENTDFQKKKPVIDNRKHKFREKEKEVWEKTKVFDIPVFKVTEKPKSEGVDEHINQIRIALNKISDKNYSSQTKIIMDCLEIVLSADIIFLSKVGHFIFDVASTNKFYSELYADLYLELIGKSPIFQEILEEFVLNYKSTIENIKYIDPIIDYDGYCNYTKENDKRRAMASFFIMLTTRCILKTEMIVDIIKHFQIILIKYIDEEGKTVECEEISEIIFIFVSLGNASKCFNKLEVWNENILVNVLSMSINKVKEHKSLTSRIVFKHKDLIDLIKKKK